MLLTNKVERYRTDGRVNLTTLPQLRRGRCVEYTLSDSFRQAPTLKVAFLPSLIPIFPTEKLRITSYYTMEAQPMTREQFHMKTTKLSNLFTRYEAIYKQMSKVRGQAKDKERLETFIERVYKAVEREQKKMPEDLRFWRGRNAKKDSKE